MCGVLAGRFSKEHDGVDDGCGAAGFQTRSYDFYALADAADSTGGETEAGRERRPGVSEPGETVEFRICSVDETVGGGVGLVPASQPCRSGSPFPGSTTPRVYVANPAIELSPAAAAAAGVQVFSNGTQSRVAAHPVWDLGSVVLRGHSLGLDPNGGCTIATVNGSAFVGVRGTSFPGVTPADVSFFRFDRRTRWVENTRSDPADENAEVCA